METVELAHLDDFAQKVLSTLRSREQKPHATLVALQGDLGSGKTTFVQALAKALGVTETLQSPTYVLMKSYPIPTSIPAIPSASLNKNAIARLLSEHRFSKLIHIDAYRLDNPQQFATLKPEQFLQDPKTLVCVEWPERVEGELPKPDLVIRFSSENMKETERGVEVQR